MKRTALKTRLSARARTALTSRTLRLAVGALRPLSHMPAIRTRALSVSVTLRVQPPNGSALRPRLVRDAELVVQRRRTAASARLLLRVLEEQLRAGAPRAGITRAAIDHAVPSAHACDVAQFIRGVTRDGYFDYAEAFVGALDSTAHRATAIAARHELACARRDENEALRLEAVAGLPLADDLAMNRMATFSRFCEMVQRAEADDDVARKLGQRLQLAGLEIGRHAASTGDADRNRDPGEVGVAVERAVLHGDIEAALRTTNDHLVLARKSVAFLTIAAAVYDLAGVPNDLLFAEVRQLGRRLTSARRSHLIVALTVLDRPGDAIDLADAPPSVERLTAHGRYAFAQALYVDRRFDDAARVLGSLAGTALHGDANKLAARVLFERGEFGAALRHRRKHGFPTGLIDEVVFHSLLHVGEIEEAFELYCPPLDNERIERCYRAGRLARGNSRLIVAQSGPGDEIQLAGCYARMVGEREETIATSDPRLTQIFRRSFPTIHFLPVERRTRRFQVGFYGPDRPARSGDDLTALMTLEASSVAHMSAEVLPARQLPSLLAGASRPFHHGPYLIADRSRTESVSKWLALQQTRANSTRPIIGVVWRSELRQMVRTIHYLALSDLLPLFELDADFLVLQHDVDRQEEQLLETVLPGRLRPPQDLDLRNDLDGLASLVSTLDVVVGIGTTVVELAGALGTPTVMIQPTHFGSWRSIGPNSADFWHPSVRVATISADCSRAACVRRAVRLVQETLSLNPSA